MGVREASRRTTPRWSNDHPLIFDRLALIRLDCQKLEKAVAVSGICSGFPEENSGENRGKIAVTLPALQNIFVNIFFVLAWEFFTEKRRDFW